MRLSTDIPPKGTKRSIAGQIRPWLPGTILLLLALLLQGFARLTPGFGQWYALHIYPLLLNTLGRFFGLLPFSAAETGIYLLAAAALWHLFFLIKRRVGMSRLPAPLPRRGLCAFLRRRASAFWGHFPLRGAGLLPERLFHSRKEGDACGAKGPLVFLRRLFTAASLLAFLFTIGCGINYYRYPFSYTCGLTIRPSSAGELYSLCLDLTEKIGQTAQELKTSAPGLTGQTAPARLTFKDLQRYGETSCRAMAGLGEEFPDLSGFYPMPKPLLVPYILSVQQLCGIYSPFTVEANYNQAIPLYNIPHTICHELSHLKGFMREDEANFIGCMACIRSDDPVFNYSGYLMGWVYAGNALASADWEAYASLRERLPQEALTDLEYNNAFWDSYDSGVAQAAAKVNDTYLKLQDQADGVQSYGRVVDLMLAYYREHPNEISY